MDAIIAPRKKRVGSGTLYVATGDPGQTIFILLEEPESSTVAKLTSVYMQVRVTLSQCLELQ